MTKSITWQTEKRKLSDLLPWERNPRQLTEAQAEHLEESLTKFGLVDPPAINTDNVIIGGHQRRNIMGLMKEYGNGAEIDVRVPSRTLTDREVEELNIRLNKNTGSFDVDALANNFEVDDLLDWGFEPFELGIEDVVDDADAEPQLDRAEELREKWGVELGQLWHLGDHRLICGDCAEYTIECDLIIADPPYGLGDKKSFNNDHPDYRDLEPFDLSMLRWHVPFVIWGGQYYQWLPEPRTDIGWVVWDKRPNLEGEKRERADRRFGQHFEIAVTNISQLRGKMYRQRWGGYYGSTEIKHKTMKPLELFEWCINSVSGDSVLDPFLGSGTTLIACENLNRKCYGVEIEPKYVAVTLQRYYDAFGIEPELIG